MFRPTFPFVRAPFVSFGALTTFLFTSKTRTTVVLNSLIILVISLSLFVRTAQAQEAPGHYARWGRNPTVTPVVGNPYMVRLKLFMHVYSTHSEEWPYGSGNYQTYWQDMKKAIFYIERSVAGSSYAPLPGGFSYYNGQTQSSENCFLVTQTNALQNSQTDYGYWYSATERSFEVQVPIVPELSTKFRISCRAAQDWNMTYGGIPVSVYPNYYNYSQSETAEVDTPPQRAFSAPQNARILNQSGAPYLVWDSVLPNVTPPDVTFDGNNAVRYVIEKSDSANGSFVSWYHVMESQLQQSGFPLPTSTTTQYYRVVAENGFNGPPGSFIYSSPPSNVVGILNSGVFQTPPDLRARATSNSVVLDWPAVSGAVFYVIKRAQAPDPVGADPTNDGFADGSWSANLDFQEIARTAPNSDVLSYTDTNVQVGKTYVYVVSAVQNIGSVIVDGATRPIYRESPDSPPVKATPNASLVAPSPLMCYITARGSGTVGAQLEWGAAAGAQSYEIQRGGVVINTTSGLSFIDWTNRAADNSTLVYSVTAIGAGGARSPAATVTALFKAPPPAVVLSGAADNASNALSWTSSAGATRYHIYRRTETTAPWHALERGTALFYTDGRVKNNQTYKYAVQSVIESNSQPTATCLILGAFSNTLDLTPRLAPNVVTSLSATPSTSGITLSWEAVTGATSGYEVWRSVGSGAWSLLQTVAHSGAASYSIINGGLTAGVTYTYVVRSLGPTGPSAFSNRVSSRLATASPATTAPRFSDLTATTVNVILPPAADPATRFELQFKRSTATTYLTLGSGLLPESNFLVTGLTPTASYDFRCLATVNNGTPTTGAVATITAPAVTLTWDPATPITCAGIRYPFDGMTIKGGQLGRFNAFLATDWDIATRLVNGLPEVRDVTDTCYYSWSIGAGNTGTFLSPADGTTVLWQAPTVTTPTKITITLIVTDGATKGNSEVGDRDDITRHFTGERRRFISEITVVP